MTVRTAIIGYGLAGRTFHAPLIEATEGLSLAAVSTSRAEQVPNGIEVIPPEAVIGDPSIELVVVASPNESHFPLARAALEVGKHVVVDKPMCVSVEEATNLIDVARRAGRLLIPFHNRRWDADFLTVRKLMASGALGRVLLFEAHWDRFRPDVAERWREMPAPGSGLLFDLGPHLIDQALILFGPPDTVVADLATQREGSEVDDYFALTMRYAASRVILSASSLVASPRPRFSVHGTAGSFVMFGLDPQENQLRAGGDVLAPEFGVDASLHGTLTIAEGSSSRIPSERGDWLNFYRGVVSAIADGGPPPVPPEDALAGLRIIEAAQREGGRS
jgi:scyllo-inositol 2-dehydrogenase (NADP+)